MPGGTARAQHSCGLDLGQSPPSGMVGKDMISIGNYNHCNIKQDILKLKSVKLFQNFTGYEEEISTLFGV
ncbi:hypothetical protein chiPu_0021030 [Chiloscyllium punctatum]|uniref:Uncharacterized protein n=1 Tax=Chiloscyllium punctatum TaxID=137246 RepID=A0A401RMJ9_CHIPU|nr:hypothetical protein [Chiloscyllium punctatum]